MPTLTATAGCASATERGTAYDCREYNPSINRRHATGVTLVNSLNFTSTKEAAL